MLTNRTRSLVVGLAAPVLSIAALSACSNDNPDQAALELVWESSDPTLQAFACDQVGDETGIAEAARGLVDLSDSEGYIVAQDNAEDFLRNVCD
ncbi:MAG: hypothetical protein CMH41_05135 [Micrococcales bacterium]|nr:hypothetical protein [Micrococcales bacterium]